MLEKLKRGFVFAYGEALVEWYLPERRWGVWFRDPRGNFLHEYPCLLNRTWQLVLDLLDILERKSTDNALSSLEENLWGDITHGLYEMLDEMMTTMYRPEPEVEVK